MLDFKRLQKSAPQGSPIRIRILLLKADRDNLTDTSTNKAMVTGNLVLLQKSTRLLAYFFTHSGSCACSSGWYRHYSLHALTISEDKISSVIVLIFFSGRCYVSMSRFYYRVLERHSVEGIPPPRPLTSQNVTVKEMPDYA